ncbi:MAG: VCBS repeat-containing protein [Candidatus Cloacimonetes bacterium]|nr:VCBS repeat-containing protein [Candidatus Cloacimonadota bacterium]
MKVDNLVLFFLFIVFLVFLLNISALQYEIPRMPESVFAEDIDLDGDKDLITGHRVVWESGETTISILINNGDGSFINSYQEFNFCGNQNDLTATLINNDSFPDIVAQMTDFSSGEAEQYIRVIMNENGIYSETIDYQLNITEPITEKTIGDINYDGAIDIVISSNNGENWGILYNNGEGQFSDPVYYDLDNYPNDIASGKLNEDNRDDIVICSSSWIRVLFSYETGFESFDLIDASDLKVKISDIDNDGDNDIVSFTSSIGNTTLFRICENIGVNNFQDHGWQQFNPVTCGFAISDLDNDNLPDIICTNENGIYILYNQGNFEFSQPIHIITPYIEFFYYPVICADLDGNNYDDIIVAIGNGIEGIIYIVFNDGEGNFVEDPVGIYNDELIINNFHIRNYPNPFSKSTTISYDLPVNIETTKIEIYNIKGEKVRTFSNLQINKSPNRQITWDGTNNYRNKVSSGVYLYQIKTDEYVSKMNKMILMKS